MQDLNTQIFLSEFKYGLTPASLLVYFVLRIRQNQNDECWPSINKIMEDADLTRPTVVKAIKQLEEKQLVEVIRKKVSAGMNEVNRYRCLKIGAIIDREKIGNKVVKKINHDKDEDSKINLPPIVKKFNPKIKNNKIKSNIDELKEYSKAKGGLMIIHKNRIEEMLKDFTVEQLKRAIDSGTKWAEKNEVGRKNLSRSIVEHSIKNSKPKVAKYMTSDEYKKKFPGKQPVKTDKEVWF